MGYTVAQANLYHTCIEQIEIRKAKDLLMIFRGALFGGEDDGE